MDSEIKKEKCAFCGELVPRYSTIYISVDEKYHCSCLKCYNSRMAEKSGIDFEHVELDPIILKDFDGVDHKFHFTVRYLGDGVSIDAFEIKNGNQSGYEFGYIGDVDEEVFNLFAKLVERMLRGLHKQHIEWDDTTNSWQITEEDVVRAQISCDLESDDAGYRHLPLVIIDGKEMKWDEFGRMLMTYEGFNFKLEVFDRSDEMP